MASTRFRVARACAGTLRETRLAAPPAASRVALLARAAADAGDLLVADHLELARAAERAQELDEIRDLRIAHHGGAQQPIVVGRDVVAAGGHEAHGILERGRAAVMEVRR